jgi:hypothetical protein
MNREEDVVHHRFTKARYEDHELNFGPSDHLSVGGSRPEELMPGFGRGGTGVIDKKKAARSGGIEQQLLDGCRAEAASSDE